MPRMPKHTKEEMPFFLNDRNRITFCELCKKCPRSCKQSFRIIEIYCRFDEARKAEEKEAKAKKKKALKYGPERNNN